MFPLVRVDTLNYRTRLMSLIYIEFIWVFYSQSGAIESSSQSESSYSKSGKSSRLKEFMIDSSTSMY